MVSLVFARLAIGVLDAGDAIDAAGTLGDARARGAVMSFDETVALAWSALARVTGSDEQSGS